MDDDLRASLLAGDLNRAENVFPLVGQASLASLIEVRPRLMQWSTNFLAASGRLQSKGAVKPCLYYFEEVRF